MSTKSACLAVVVIWNVVIAASLVVSARPQQPPQRAQRQQQQQQVSYQDILDRLEAVETLAADNRDDLDVWLFSDIGALERVVILEESMSDHGIHLSDGSGQQLVDRVDQLWAEVFGP